MDEFRPEPGRYPNPDLPYSLLAVADREVVEEAPAADDWNELRRLARGPKIEIWLNVIPPGSPAVQGADMIADQLWKPMFEAFTADAQLPADEIRLNGSQGFVRGTYAMKLHPKGDGDSMEEKGRYIDIVERDTEGKWRISRAIWNAS